MGRTRNRKTKRQPAPEWQAFQARLIHDDQIQYEIVRPMLMLGQSIADLREVYVFPPPSPAPQGLLWDEETRQTIEWRKVYRVPEYAPRWATSRPDALQLDLFGWREKRART